MINTIRTKRRRFLKGSLGTAALGALGSRAFASKATPTPSLNLTDPSSRAKIRAKVLGSTRNELVYTFYRLHIYGYMNDGNLIPFFTMNNLNLTRWSALENGNFATVGAECGVYCKFDTDEVLDVWENPITHEKRKVWEFIGGPLVTEIGPDGIVTDGAAELKPEVLRMEILGNKLFMPTQAALSMPNPFTPEKWPKSSSGKTRYWDSLLVASADVADVADPNVTNVRAFLQFQNLGSWHPWLGMGGYEGRTYGRAYGTKLASLDELPKSVLKGIEAKTPEIFNYESWQTPRIDMLDYMNAHTPE
ncbi:MAG: DUF1838 family protein [Alteromonadaceae bacterium]|nr:DUF1838 family protein [Alteromonadaceae bacterium]